MELIRNVGRWGNSAGVLLPREWVGNQVKIIFVDRTSEVKKETLNILGPYLEDILGIYLTGSYARGEQEENSDIDIIVISNETKKEIISGKYHISILTLDGIHKNLHSNPELVLPRLFEAKTILNKSLLEELKSGKIEANSFKGFVEESKRIIRINKGLINLDKEEGHKNLDSINVVYSVLLRLRGVFLINLLLKKEKYSKKGFLKWLEENIPNVEIVYDIYKKIRDNKKVKADVKIDLIERLLGKLEEEINKLKNKLKK